MTDIIKTSLISYHDSNLYPFLANANAKANSEHANPIFGIVELELNETPVIQTPLFLYFTVDESGSMDEMGKNGRRKIWYVKRTFTKMLKFISDTPEATVYIKVVAFDDTIRTIIETVQITPENLESLIAKIDTITPNGSTNIELALTTANNNMLKYADANPNHRITHVFLTDGDITAGCQCYDTLTSIILSEAKSETKSETDTKIRSVFIGFGEMHNYKLLNQLGETKRGEYRFIDNGESSGIVYGEVLSRILRPSLDDVTLTINNGAEIYDWQTNTWTTSIYEDIIDSGAKKTYHIRHNKNESVNESLNNIQIEVRGLESNLEACACVAGSGCNCNCDLVVPPIIDIVTPLPPLIDLSNGIEDNCYVNLTKYVFRQKVMEHLYASKISGKYANKTEKTNIATLFREIRKYMRENDLMQDPFMIILCDDLITSYRYYGMNMNHMYCSARQVSQGRQYTYTPMYKRGNPKCRPPLLRRQQARSYSDITVIDNQDNLGISTQFYNDDFVDIVDNDTNDDNESFALNMQNCENWYTRTKKPQTMGSPLDVDEDMDMPKLHPEIQSHDACDDIEQFIYKQYDFNDSFNDSYNDSFNDSNNDSNNDSQMNTLTLSPYATSNRIRTINALTQSE